MKRTPPNWTPPVEAFQGEFNPDIDEVVFAYFGVQTAAQLTPVAFIQWFIEASGGHNAPAFATRATHQDASGYHNDVFIGYWPSQAAFDAWWSHAKTWWNDTQHLQADYGLWREQFLVPTRRFETLSSSRTAAGVAKLARPFGQAIRDHAYWGGMRDRISDSQTDQFESPLGSVVPQFQLQETRGKCLRIKPPNNLCLIRSGQNWADSSGEELHHYLDIVRPSLTAGMAFLRDNAETTGCLSCRFMDEVGLNGKSLPQTFGLALFLTMQQLEDWAEHHPTHLAIFGDFFKLVKARGGELDLKLWHEVLILSDQHSYFEYSNCHPRTGLLPYFPGEKI